MVRLGSEVTDSITGFSGIVTGRTEYITGCNQILVAPRVGADGSYKESQWFDEDRLVVNKETQYVLPRRTANGFDKPAPKC